MLKTNNPGNIRRNQIQWQGEEAGSSEFAEFDTAQDGIRAMAKILLNYQTRDGLTSVRQMISRWAPPTENQTISYVHDVAEAMDIGADNQVTLLTDAPRFLAMVKAIILRENGSQPYDDATVQAGIALALGNPTA